MPELDSLTLRIEVDLSGLRRGLREAEQLVSQSSRSMTESLSGVEESLRKIGAKSSTLQLPMGNSERRITSGDRVGGAVLGLGIAGAALTLTGPVTIAVGAATLIAGTAMGAFTPDAQALLSSALSEPPLTDRIAELENKIEQLQSVQGIRTGMEFGDAIREKDLRERILRLQQERSDLLGQLDRERTLQDKLSFNDRGLISGFDNQETLIGSAGEDALRTREKVEDLGDAIEEVSISAVGFAETQSNVLDIFSRKSEEARASAQNLDGAARDLGFTFASSFEDAVVEGRRLSDVLQGLERDILRILTRKLVTEPLAGGLTSLIGSGLGVLSGEFHGGGRAGATPVSGRVVPASMFDGAPRFAEDGYSVFQPRNLILRKRVKNLLVPW